MQTRYLLQKGTGVGNKYHKKSAGQKRTCSDGKYAVTSDPHGLVSR